jgi:hypothetical protein
MLLRKFGFHEVSSVFLVQIATDYLDRIITVSLVLFLAEVLPKEIIRKIRGTGYEQI